MANKLIYILKTELFLRVRHSHAWLYPLIFFMIVICLFPLAFSPEANFFAKYIVGCVWIAALLASLLSIETIFTADIEDNHLEQLVLTQELFTEIIAIKLLAQWITSQLPLIILTPFIAFTFHLSLHSTILLVLTMFLGTPIFTLIGSLSVALTIGLRQAGMLIGLLTLPLLMPILIFSVLIVQQSAAGLGIKGPLAFLAGILILSLAFLPWAIASMLRLSLDD